MASRPDRYIGDIAADYQFEDEADLDRKVHLERDFWRDSDNGHFLLFRRQRQLEQLSNVRDGSKATAGFFGHRIGAANKSAALGLASGHTGAMKFPYNVLYELDAEDSNEVVDLRRIGDGAPLGAVVLHALSITTGPIVGTRLFDEHSALKDQPIITERPIMQRLLTPDIGRQAEDQPAAFMHVPYAERAALRALAHQNRFNNRT